MPGDGRLLLEDHHGDLRLRQLPGHGQPDEARPDDADGVREAGRRHHANRTAAVLRQV